MPAGTHLVKMSFEPPLWRWGLLVAGLTVAGMGMTAVAIFLRRPV
jgi:hypothetical protein